MKKVILLSLLACCGTPSALLAQFTVLDPVNEYLQGVNIAIQENQIVQTLEQIEQTKRQIDIAKSQVEYAKRTYTKQVETLVGLPNRDWNSVEEINDNIDAITNTSTRLQNMNRYVEGNYRYLYNQFERLEEVATGPDRAEEIEQERDDYMKMQADRMAAISAAVSEASTNTDAYLRDLELATAAGDLTPQQQRELSGQLLASLNQQVSQLQKAVASYNEFAAVQFRMEQAQAEDDEEAARQRDKEIKEAWERLKHQNAGRELDIIYQGDHE